MDKKYLISLLFMLFLLMGCQKNEPVQLIDETKPFELKFEDGMQLLYSYDMQGSPVSLKVTLDRREDGTALIWESSDPAPASGSRLIGSEALENSEAEFANFYPGDDAFGDRTTLLFPRLKYNELIERDTTLFKPLGIDQDEPTHLINKGMETMTVDIDGRAVNVEVIVVEERVLRRFQYKILADYDFPVILERSGNFNMKIERILTPAR